MVNKMEQPLWDNIGDDIADDFQQDDFWEAFAAFCGAIQDSLDPEERNNQLRKMGEYMFRAGICIAGASLMTVISDQPPNNRLIFSDVIPRCCLFFAGSVGMIVGWFLMCCNNPSRYLNLASLAILPLAFGYVFTKVFD